MTRLFSIAVLLLVLMTAAFVPIALADDDEDGGGNGNGGNGGNAGLSGYEVVKSPPLAFGDGGFGGWSCPLGKTILDGGFEATDPVSVSAPGTPGSVWPHHVFGPVESGWVVQDDLDGSPNTITIYAICANAPPGYEVVNSPPLVFGDGGYGGWSCPAGKVVLGGGFQGTDPVAVSAPGTPGSVWPHHTFGPNEYGWVIRDDPNGAQNLITVFAICANAPSGYEVVNSPPLEFGDGGWGGWSCPSGKVVTGGGFDARDTVAVSAPGTPGSVWPHHAFGPNEYGWVVRDDPNGAGNVITVYAICALVAADEAKCPDDDEDDDGLSDEHELSLLTLLGNPDSDLDGVSDGNDDANGNGLDDEDEDDGDDPCPNDSDDDGEDDEDEDD